MSSIQQKQSIKTIECKEGYLAVLYDKYWSQEDIHSLSEQLLDPVMPVKFQEKNIGADREAIRFSWNDHFFVLNFDCYSQSCWIEGQDDSEVEYLDTLHTAMIKG